MKSIFYFAISDSMFSGDCIICRRVLSIDEAKNRIAQGVESFCNTSHKTTIKVKQ